MGSTTAEAFEILLFFLLKHHPRKCHRIGDDTDPLAASGSKLGVKSYQHPPPGFSCAEHPPQG